MIVEPRNARGRRPVAIALAVVVLGFAWLREPSLTMALVGLLAVMVLFRTAARSPHGLCWGLLAAGTTLWLAADLAPRLFDPANGAAASASWSDISYIAGQALLAAGLLCLGGRGRRPAATVDAAIVVTAGAGLIWYFLVVPLVEQRGVSLLVATLTGVVPALTLGLVACAARLVLASSPRDGVSLPLLIAMLGMLLADAAHGLERVNGSPWSGVDYFILGCLVFYMALIVAALHPTAPSWKPAGLDHTRTGGSRARLVTLGLAGASVPVLTVVGAVHHADTLLMLPLAVITVVMFTLILLRLAGLLVTVEGAARGLTERSRELERHSTALADSLQQRQLLESDLRHQALHDVLTGLPNRALFTDRLCHALSRRDTDVFAVAFLDLDGFKSVNDSDGHRAGDELLVAVAGRLRESVREGDTLARLGGDEFAVLLHGLDDVAGARRAVERLLDGLREPLDAAGRQRRVQASVGVAVAMRDERLWPSAEEFAGELLARADTAMYVAKGRGGQQYALYESGMRDDVIKTLQLREDLNGAVERGELAAHYQPIVHSGSGQVVAVEALVRWHHPERGLLYPDAFLHAAEESGVIADIDAAVLRLACAQLAQWRREVPGAADVRIAVNISGRTLFQGAVLPDVRQALAASALPASALILEVTEQVLVHDLDRISAQLDELRRDGVQIFLDDFGTGYSSLTYLHRLPVDAIKVARQFVERVDTGPEGAAFAAAIAGLGKALGLSVLAEGIETAGQYHAMTALGCDLAQGYLLATPTPPEGIRPLLGVAVHAAQPAPPTPGPEAARPESVFNEGGGVVHIDRDTLITLLEARPSIADRRRT